MSATFPHAFALLIGVNENLAPDAALPTVAKDVQVVQRVLAHPQRCAYPPDNVRRLLGQQATRQGIFDGLAWLKGKLAARPDSTAVVYYSGHGWRDTSTPAPAYYLIPYDLDPQRVRFTALRADDFAAEIAALQPLRLLVLLDCCHAAGMTAKDMPGVKDFNAMGSYTPAAIPAALLMGGEAAQTPQAGAKGLEQLAQGRGRAVLSSSQGDQVSYLRKDQQMSIFTYHLIEALTGHAQMPGATEVLVSDVMSYVHRCVPASAQREYKAIQQPDYQVSGNFPVALVLGGQGIGKGLTPPDPLQDLKGSLPPQSSPIYSATLTGSGAIAQGPGSTGVGAGGVIVKGDVAGDVVTGTKKVVNTNGGPYFGGKTKIDNYVQGDQTLHYEDRSAHIHGNGNTAITGDNNWVDIRPAGDSPTRQEFLDLLRQLQSGLSQAPLPTGERADLLDDLGKVERQAAEPQPNAPGIFSRLELVVNFLANSATLVTVAPQLLEMGRKLLEWAKLVF